MKRSLLFGPAAILAALAALPMAPSLRIADQQPVMRVREPDPEKDAPQLSRQQRRRLAREAAKRKPR